MGQGKKQSPSEEFSLKDLELQPKSLKAGEYPSEEVYWLHYTDPAAQEGDQSCGLFWKFDLKDYLQKNMHLNPHFEICPYAQDPEVKENWYPLFDEPFFQRRKETPKAHEVDSQLSQMHWSEDQGEDKENIYLLVHGQKIGPYNLQDIRQRLKEGAILVTDMISVDGGKSWGHLYEIAEFDRRVWDPRHLPHRPEEESANDKSEPLFDEADDLNVVADLAHQGFTGSYEAPVPPQKAVNEKNLWNTAKVSAFGVFLFCAVAMGSLYLFENSTNNPGKTNSTVAEQEKSHAPKEQTRKPAQIPHQSTGSKEKPKQVKEKQVNGPKDSQKTVQKSEKKPSDSQVTVKDTSRDDRYYDTQKDPVRLEPVKERPQGRETAAENWDRDRSRSQRGEDTRSWGDWEKRRSKNRESDPYARERYPRENRPYAEDGPRGRRPNNRDDRGEYREAYRDDRRNDLPENYRGDYREYEDVETYNEERDYQRDAPPEERGWER